MVERDPNSLNGIRRVHGRARTDPSPTTLLTRVKSKLFVHARRRSRSMLEGEYASVFHGRSLDYDDLRDYVLGDEVRDIDWKATARHTRPLVKRYVAHRKQNLMLVVDTGRGMAATTRSGEAEEGGRDRRRRAHRLARPAARRPRRARARHRDLHRRARPARHGGPPRAAPAGHRLVHEPRRRTEQPRHPAAVDRLERQAPPLPARRRRRPRSRPRHRRAAAAPPRAARDPLDHRRGRRPDHDRGPSARPTTCPTPTRCPRSCVSTRGCGPRTPPRWPGGSSARHALLDRRAINHARIGSSDEVVTTVFAMLERQRRAHR